MNTLPAELRDRMTELDLNKLREIAEAATPGPWEAGMNEWRRVSGADAPLLADFEMAGQGDRIIYLPRGDSDE